MRKLAVVLFALGSLCLMATPAAAINWGIGADLGYTMFMPDDEYDLENINMISLPMSGGPMAEIGVPAIGGLRLSFAGENPMHEVWVGTALNRLSVEDYSLMAMQLSGNYQFNFAVQSDIKPYLTAGVGLFRVGDEDDSASSVYFGGGVGAAFKMGTGRLRGELRYDAVGEGTIGDEDWVAIPKGGSLGFKLGFDLWAK